MDGRLMNSPLSNEQEDNENSPQNSGDSLPSGRFNDTKLTSLSSPKKSRRGTQKRVVSVPIRDVEGSRFKGETSSPPSDSWAWRKYGQKPIKGSPYPRGYYRCSSSKGCPARKQVERSHVDPTMLVVTYTCEHNHPWPANKNNNHNHNRNHQQNVSAATAVVVAATTTTTTTVTIETATIATVVSTPVFADQLELDMDEKFTNLIDETDLMNDHQFGWFPELESTSSTILESPVMAADSVSSVSDADMNMIFSMREEDELLFADLGELPECSVVFCWKEKRGLDDVA